MKSPGKIFEAKISKAFRPLVENFPCVFERVADAATAGTLAFKKADADFKLIVKETETTSKVYYIECKSSVNTDNFMSVFRQSIKPHQLASLRMAERAGCIGLIFFQPFTGNEVHVWTLKQIKELYYQKGKSFLQKEPAVVVSNKNLTTFAESFVNGSLKLD